jgi:hypothetical protein
MIQRGSTVYLEARVYDATVTPPVLFNPVGGVFLTLWRPDGTVALNEAAMSGGNTGVFSRRYQTTLSDPPGVWRAQVKTVNATDVVYSVPAVVFVLVD